MAFTEPQLPAVIHENGVDTYRTSTNAATLCAAIVKQTASDINGKKYVACTGWQAIAVAHGCTASACNVERVDGGFRATGQVRRMDNGAVIAEAEGFVGEDEAVWFGGETVDKWGKKKVHKKRPDFAIRAMAQTRAISRACRSAFAHVVVMIDASLGTTPAEEMQGVVDVDGPGSSWGPTGKEGVIADAERDGLMKNAPKVTAAKRKQFETWTGNAVGTLKLSGQTKESLYGFWEECEAKRETLAEYAPDLLKTLTAAYDDALAAVEAKAA